MTDPEQRRQSKVQQIEWALLRVGVSTGEPEDDRYEPECAQDPESVPAGTPHPGRWPQHIGDGSRLLGPELPQTRKSARRFGVRERPRSPAGHRSLGLTSEDRDTVVILVGLPLAKAASLNAAVHRARHATGVAAGQCASLLCQRDRVVAALALVRMHPARVTPRRVLARKRRGGEKQNRDDHECCACCRSHVSPKSRMRLVSHTPAALQARRK